MAASLALAGISAACTRQPTESIVPYVRQPEQFIPGRPLYYATAMTLGGYATGLLVESHLGRPTKIEGNELHPASLGATDAFAQASILSLYDPDRSQSRARSQAHQHLERVSGGAQPRAGQPSRQARRRPAPPD
jgi:molybdopterin-containing oxidoreductase family iron-sulfur binding subunit